MMLRSELKDLMYVLMHDERVIGSDITAVNIGLVTKEH